MADEPTFELDGVFKPDTLSKKTFFRPQRKILSIDEEFEQIRKCRYIRKTPFQRKDSSNLDLDISFLCHHNKNEIEPVKVEQVEEQQDELNKKRQIAQDLNDGLKKLVTEETQSDTKPAIQPVIPSKPATITGREKLKPLVLSDFNSKCTITSSLTNHQLKKRPVSQKRGKRLDYLYKEITAAARNADVNLSNVVRGVRDDQKKEYQWEKMRKSDQSLRRWGYLSSLVRSGWLLGKRGRSLKMMEDRILKRRLYETNLGTLPISYQASLRKSERTAAHASFFQRKLAENRSESNFSGLGSRMSGGWLNSLPELNFPNKTIISRDFKRRSSKTI